MFSDCFFSSDDPCFTLNSWSKIKNKLKVYGMFNNFQWKEYQGVEVDLTHWSKENIDEDCCYALFGGEYVRYSSEYLEQMEAWLLLEFPWSENMKMEKLFIDYTLDF